MLSRLPNLTRLTPKYRGPKMGTPSSGLVQGLRHTYSANSCAVPCFAWNPEMCQQSSFQVTTLFLDSDWPFNSLTTSSVCSGARIQCSHEQSNHDHRPIHHGLASCFNPFCMVEFTRNTATDCPPSSCVVRGFEVVSGYLDSSFHRVRRLPSDSHLINPFGS